MSHKKLLTLFLSSILFLSFFSCDVEVDGKNGSQGSAGTAGTAGAQGEQGLRGATGLSGDYVYEIGKIEDADKLTSIENLFYFDGAAAATAKGTGFTDETRTKYDVEEGTYIQNIHAVPLWFRVKSEEYSLGTPATNKSTFFVDFSKTWKKETTEAEKTETNSQGTTLLGNGFEAGEEYLIVMDYKINGELYTTGRGDKKRVVEKDLQEKDSEIGYVSLVFSDDVKYTTYIYGGGDARLQGAYVPDDNSKYLTITKDYEYKVVEYGDGSQASSAEHYSKYFGEDNYTWKIHNVADGNVGTLQLRFTFPEENNDVKKVTTTLKNASNNELHVFHDDQNNNNNTGYLFTSASGTFTQATLANYEVTEEAVTDITATDLNSFMGINFTINKKIPAYPEGWSKNHHGGQYDTASGEGTGFEVTGLKIAKITQEQK